MPPSNSIIRRYTPPTCTLEILAQSSSLSQWMGKPVLKQLSFELRFDDPRLPEERRVPIRGDRDQLEALCDTVTSYVQQFLQQPPESFWNSFSSLPDSSKVPNDSELTDFPEPSQPTKTISSFTPSIAGTRIYLESSSYLTHNLFLGSLANQASGNVIQLSLLQLFDLATALDEYSADVMALPTLNNRSSVRRLPTWAPVAAVLVLGVGLLPITLQYANSIRQKQPQTAKKTTATPEEVALAPSLDFPTPGVTSPDGFQSLPPLGSAPPLPTSALPEQPLTAPSSSSANSPTSPIAGLPPASLGTPNNSPTIPQGTIPNLNSSQPGSASTTIPGQIAIQPNPAGLTSQDRTTLSQTQKPISKSSLTAPTSGLSPNSLPSLAPLTGIPNNGTTYSPVDPKQLEDRINSARTTSASGKPASELSSPTTSSNGALAGRLRGESKPSTEVATGTLFDTPQIAQARNILKKRWQPPAGFSQTLEYSLMVGVDGTIERILPLNKAARDYFDDTGMPEIGKPFVSANRYGKNLRLRVVLNPDGSVQTLPESE